VLLIVNKDASKPVEEVRKRFDPLSQKIPAHITVLYSEASNKIQVNILKSIDTSKLPSVKELTFDSIQIVDEMYLWLIPNADTEQKLKQWHEEFKVTLGEGHSQGEKYQPHITLGYVPRKLPEEDALAFASSHISLPLTLQIDSVLLEEFSEDQNSKSLDRLTIST
jgi:2'-5' RNA ligase